MRGNRTLLALAAAALAAGLAFWLLRTPGPPPPAADTVSPSDTRPADEASTVSPEDTKTPALPTSDGGVVTGALVVPALPGSPAGTVALSILREGEVVATAGSPPGLFRVDYPRAAGDAAPFVLRAEVPRRPPVLVALPTRVADVGEVRLLAGLVYGGRLVDGSNRPVEGVVVDFNVHQQVAASSAPSGADGTFLVPLPPGVSLQGIHGQDANGWAGGPPMLEPRARGRLFLPVETKPEGLAGAHEVVLEERPVAIRFRFLAEGTGQPVPGAAASLWSGQDFGFTLPNLAPFDAGVSDAEGIYAPLWPLSAMHKWALLRVREPGGRVLWTLLDRSDCESKEPRDLLLPREPLVLAVRCVEAGSGKPVPAAQVVLGTNAGMPLSGTTDGKGEIRWALFPSDSFDPEPLEAAGWSAAWRDASGNPRREMDMNFRGPPSAEEGPSPIFAEPLVIRLGGRADGGIWVRIEEPAGAAPFRPQVIRACIAPEKGYFLFSGQFAGPVPDAAGRPLWWCWEWMMAATADAYMPKEGTFTVELLGPGRDPLSRTADRAAVQASHRAEGALVFAAPVVDSMTRSLLVVGTDGKPAPGTIVVVLSKAVADPMGTQERERGTAGADGRLTLHTLDPRGDCRVAAWDPATGGSAAMRGLDETAAPERWRLALEAPREFRVRVKFAGGATLVNSGASLVPLSTAFPSVPPLQSKDGDLSVPSCPVAVCTAWIYGIGPRNDYRFVQGPAAGFHGKDVVLEKK